jgi:hypothetical protein
METQTASEAPKKPVGMTPLYPFRTMNVGETYEVDYLDGNPFSAKACASRIGRITGRRFSSKRTKTGVIITRVA